MKDFIYCQRAIPREQWRYGLRSSAATGCGWIATYNALLLLGKTPPDPAQLIRDYERQVPVINGNLGTVFFGPALWFRKRGYKVKAYTRREDFDAAARQAPASILFYRWLKKYKYGAHFVALHHTQEGFTAYNTYRNSTGPDRYGDSLSGFLKRKKYFTPVLFTVEMP